MSYFEVKPFDPRCSNCAVKNKGLTVEKKQSSLIAKRGKPDVLVIVEYVEDEKQINKLIRFLERKRINNYEIRAGLQCSMVHGVLPNPISTLYKNCNPIEEKDYKVIITVGRAINAIAQMTDLKKINSMSWTDFSEYKFNRTYFFTPLKWKYKIRVYPLPMLIDWMGKDNFENYFVNKQMKQIQSYLQSYKPEKKKEFKIEIVKDTSAFFREHMSKKDFAIDTETTGLGIYDDGFSCRCVTISFDGITGYYLKFEDIDKKLFSEFLKGKKQYYVNGKFDCKVLKRCGVSNAVVDEDAYLLFHCLSTERSHNDLKTLAWLIGLGGYEDELVKYFKEYKKGISWHNVPHDILHRYATIDAIATYRLVKLGWRLAKKQVHVYKVYKKYLIGVLPVFQAMEEEGMQVNREYVNKLNKELVDEKLLWSKIIEADLKIDNVNSIEQMGKALELMGWTCHGRSTKKYWLDEKNKKHYYYKVGAPQLEAWKKEGFKLAETILRYRTVDTLNKTFVGSIPEEEDENKSFFSFDREDKHKKSSDKGIIQYIADDGKIHGTFAPGGTNTMRTLGFDPNLQNQPKQGAEGKRFRPCYACPDDYLICEADYSGFQLRIGAIYSGDKTMSDIFLNRGGDMHSITAQGVFSRDKTVDEFLQLKGQEPYKTYRFRAKQVNFGFIFGRSAQGFKPDLDNSWTDDEINEYIKQNKLKLVEDQHGNKDAYLTVADDIRKKFFQTYRQLEPWINDQHEFAKDNGYVISYHGAVRHLPYVTYIGKDSDWKKVSGALNIAVNSPVQAFEAIEIYKALIDIYKYMQKHNMKSKLVASVHDSIVLYIHKDEVKEMAILLKDSMSSNEYDIPIESEVEYGGVWGFGFELDMKDYDNIVWYENTKDKDGNKKVIKHELDELYDFIKKEVA